MGITRIVALLMAALGALLPTQPQAAVGRTEGTAVVTATGAGEYSISLWVPPGTRGVQPSLSLNYSSRTGTGHFGFGWQLGGLSAIARCQKTWAQDGAPRDVRNEATDRFCLDGNQLRLVGGAAYGTDGAEYRTEMETFARIRSYGVAGNGPAYFRVEQKNGLIFEYGNTADSQILSVGQTTARLWAVNKISDRAGNAMLFSYVEDAANGSFRIDRIQYTQNETAGGNPHYEVKFYYEPLPADEIDLRYMAQSVIRRTVRASRIDITHDTEIIRRYTLTYEPLSTTARSRLASLQECAGPTIDCLPASIFTYQNATAGLNVEINSGVGVPVNPISPLRLDVNADGRDDLVFSSTTTSGTGHWMVALANGAGYSTATNTGIVNNNYIGALPFDYNADGLDDLLVPYSGGTWWVMLGMSSGLATPFDTGVATTTTGVGGNARAIDINGDGLQDLVWVDLFGWAGGDAIRYRLREAGGTFSSTVQTLIGPMQPESMILNASFGIEGRNGARVPDFNGDGGGDIVYRHARREWDDETRTYTYQYTIAAHCPNSFAFASGTSLSTGTGYPYFGDFNGDGKSDLVHRTAANYYLRLSTGKSFHSVNLTSLDAYGVDWIILDWDGDGFDDVLLPHTTSGQWYLMRSKGESFAAPVSTGISWSGTENTIVMDVNGDGIRDLGYNAGGAWKYRVHNGVPGDMLLSATDGFGNSATFGYASLSSYGLYTRQGTAAFPMQDYRGPLYVVSQLSQSDGIGGTYNLQNFTYEGAKFDLQAADSLDSRTGLGWIVVTIPFSVASTGKIFRISVSS